VSHVSRGHGSAIFLEFGKLTVRTFRNGRIRDRQGEFGLMIEWSWRIEDRSSIICGSWSDEELWQPAFETLLNKQVLGVSIFGRLPEISISLSGDLFVSSFMTSDGQPAWALFDRRQAEISWVKSCGGEIVEERQTGKTMNSS
jgi:hypothetical protein